MAKVDFKKMSAHRTPEESPGFLLWRASSRWRRAIEKILKPLELTHPQFVILAAVGWLTRSGEQASQAEVGRFAELDPNTTSQILRSLEAKGFVERARTTDERSKQPRLTAMGAQRLLTALPAVENVDATFFAAVNLHEEVALRALQTLAGLDKGDEFS